jgi:hypothetical protein
MGLVSFLALVLLSLAGYSAGASLKSKRSAELKPQLIDMILIAFIWIGAIYSRAHSSLNKWLMILLWLILGMAAGYLALWARMVSKRKMPAVQKELQTSPKIRKKIWNIWKDLSKKMGGFQSRIILSLFYFVFVSPIALLVRAFSDPLKIKPGKTESINTYWLPRRAANPSKEQSRRQF